MEHNKQIGWLPGRPTPTPPILPPVPMPTPPVIEQPELCDEMVLVMSYVKMQQWGQLYEPEAGMERGTIFPELDLPFVGEGACRND